MATNILKNRKLKDQVGIQNDLIKIQEKKIKQEDKDERLFDMDITYFGNRLIRNVWL